MSKLLTFEPSAFRDWTSIYCWFAYDMFTKGFKEQLGWNYSDVIFVWDGEKVTIFRAVEEHIHEFLSLTRKRLSADPNFIMQVSQRVLNEVTQIRPFLEKILKADLAKYSNQDVLKYLEILRQSVLSITPWFLILMYFPQQLERIGKTDFYQKDFNKAIETRGRVDKILGPLSNKATEVLAEEVLSRAGIAVIYARFLMPAEFQALLSSLVSQKYIYNLTQVLKRRQLYWMIAGDKLRAGSVEQYIKRHKWKLVLPETKNNITKITGSATYITENVIGVVRIVANQRQISKVQQNDIIVAPMTTPEYGPIFSKIKAIVTDEGGVTCHAAIVSREMKIPAIVGTHIASQILKDGDRVKVDTKKGVISIISRS